MSHVELVVTIPRASDFQLSTRRSSVHSREKAAVLTKTLRRLVLVPVKEINALPDKAGHLLLAGEK